MNRILFSFLICSVPCFAASPTFGNFNQTQFNTNSLRVNIKSGAVVTNMALAGSATGNVLTLSNSISAGTATFNTVVSTTSVATATATVNNLTATNSVLIQSLTASRLALIGADKTVTNSATVTTTEAEYLDGVTSPIQTQIDGIHALTNIITRLYTSSGTWTNQVGLLYITIEMVGGGGGGGGATNGASATFSLGGGGGSGAFSRRKLNAAQLTNTTETITIGALGAGGGQAGAGGSGAAGGLSSFGTTNTGTFFFAPGGSGGTSFTATGGFALGGAGGIAGNLGDLDIAGSPGFAGVSTTINVACSGQGAPSVFSGFGQQRCTTSTSQALNGNSATGYGCGGAGGLTTGSTAQAAKGGDGAAGLIQITEVYIR